MQIEVAARTAELAEVNAQLRPEIAARTQAEEQLRLADRRKGEFLATLAGGISIAVRDSGIGFEPSAAAEMFDMFTQVSASRPVGEKGLGIGLALVKAFLALHGGTVEASSAGANHGSEFRIRIPGSIVIGRQAGLALNPSDIPVSNGTRCKVCSSSTTIGIQPMRWRWCSRRMVATSWWGIRVRRRSTWPRDRGPGWGQAKDKDRAKAAGFDRHFTKPLDPGELQALLATFIRERRRA